VERCHWLDDMVVELLRPGLDVSCWWSSIMVRWCQRILR